ncbi:hypothetical protein [Chlorobium phaeobacteroides]|jgi:hypothetical protein|uniref:Uncharacterized protein n=1 Tax=Chlorobium phaeobacteroides (strain DSM 266 / SMG 266 / 2430) TaxID=290317 RepID=A1BDQ0_CHLPD|nr:hypothetical protein [Chlorobium phaeobacteroides]ABL64527.1 hypothetical protein Cpha266_0470 [Chlorobium phaeobacteroides DSM 266]MBV5326574.1 hypothetical protein [Chlorobium sp.]
MNKKTTKALTLAAAVTSLGASLGVVTRHAEARTTLSQGTADTLRQSDQIKLSNQQKLSTQGKISTQSKTHVQTGTSNQIKWQNSK